MLWGKGRGNITVHVIGNNLCCKRHSGLKPTSTRFRPAYLCPKESLTAVGCRKSYIFICLQGTAGGLVQDWGLQGTTVNVRGRTSLKKLGNLMEVEALCIVEGEEWTCCGLAGLRGQDSHCNPTASRCQYSSWKHQNKCEGSSFPMNFAFQRSLRHVIRLPVVLGWVSSHKAIVQAAASAAELWEGVGFQVITQLYSWRIPPTWQMKMTHKEFPSNLKQSLPRIDMPCGPSARPNVFKCIAAPSYLCLPAVGCCGIAIVVDGSEKILLMALCIFVVHMWSLQLLSLFKANPATHETGSMAGWGLAAQLRNESL